MTIPPRPAHTYTWDGHTLPTWLHPDQHHHDNGQLVIHTPDGHARPRPGWTLIAWTDNTITTATPHIAEREYGPAGAYRQLAQAEADMQRVTALYERWVKAGPPPLGAPLARWWDARLAELRNAINRAAEQPARTIANNPPTSKD